MIKNGIKKYKKKFHETYYVMCLRLTLNHELDLASFMLFQNGVK